MTTLKLSEDEVDNMSFPLAIGLQEYWLDFPPEHVSLRFLLQAFTNWKPKVKATKFDPASLWEMRKMLGPTAMITEKLPDRVRELIKLGESMTAKLNKQTDS
jgi:hypothetical protein